MDIINNITSEICIKLANKLDETLIDGLKLKGFEFSNKTELEIFVKENCRCEDNIDQKEKVFFVKGIPFLLYDYNIIFDDFDLKEPFKLKVNYGTYIFL